ncbi:hypothetical protein A4A49_28312 [Nicotiana attenuata]|uniref:Uncharacterized protein n=1 Tax=Nicotiana attenuata TaxID=49451 RepID=A0A1J6JBS0_NICAT|nr:hypothetical protein A4A49_62982 [Nicotiana attenuata]OIT33810.1 hypothetical protein A4A49_28312 [Nicotiana attenuata]
MAIDSSVGGGFLVGKGNFYPLAFSIPFESALNGLKENDNLKRNLKGKADYVYPISVLSSYSIFNKY